MAHKEKNLQTIQEVEVVEIFDDNGKSLTFELLSTVPYKTQNFLVVTPFIQNESKIDLKIPPQIFVMQEITNKDGDNWIKPVDDFSIIHRIYAKLGGKTYAKLYLQHRKEGKRIERETEKLREKLDSIDNMDPIEKLREVNRYKLKAVFSWADDFLERSNKCIYEMIIRK